MSASRRNLVWPLLVIAIGITLFLISADVLPDAVRDLITRSWPILLVMFGLNILLVGRIRYANWIVLIFSAVLVGVVINLAYNTQSQEYRADYRETWSQPLPDEIQRVSISIKLRNTQSTIAVYSVSEAEFPDPQVFAREQRRLEARFSGSNESDVAIRLNHEVGSPTATLEITESYLNDFPRLEDVGRGTLNIFLPSAVVIDSIEYESGDSPLAVDLQGVQIDSTLNLRLSFLVERGNMSLILPDDGRVFREKIQINNGDLRLVVNENRRLYLDLAENTNIQFIPESARQSYLALEGKIYQTEGVSGRNFDVDLDIVVNGNLILEHTPPVTP